MKSIKIILIVLAIFPTFIIAQNKNSSDNIFQEIKKLSVHGNVLYIAAHPDDENTKLLAFLSNEKLYNTAYLSLTRGDGGQNLIGDEQGIELGLIRTNELLEARKVDGTKQFFSRAYDFGFSKSPAEALNIWGHDKILSDVVWAIRKFRPDVIICRFPTTGEGGHGHHTASAILASEAFEAAADPTKFPEQLKLGVNTWQAKRLLWNTFNFGSTNTQNENQFKIDCGGYNPVLGKSYGEISATSRSKHSSQGFGVAASRGTSIEYFTTIKGTPPVNDLMDGVDLSLNKTEIKSDNLKQQYANVLRSLINNYKINSPQSSIEDLQKLQKISLMSGSSPMLLQKRKEIEDLILKCSGIFFEGTSLVQKNIIGDSIKINFLFNNRLGINVTNVRTGFIFDSTKYNEIELIQKPEFNTNISRLVSIPVSDEMTATQPFWLKDAKQPGSFTISDQTKRILPYINETKVYFSFKINGLDYFFTEPLDYKFIDPVKGELYQPAIITNPVDIKANKSLIIVKDKNNDLQKIGYTIHFNKDFNDKLSFYIQSDKNQTKVLDTILNKKAGESFSLETNIPSSNKNEITVFCWLSSPAFNNYKNLKKISTTLKKISYSHIPDIFYHYTDSVKILFLDLKTTGKNIGYITGAGDKVPEALSLMGYNVTFLSEKDATSGNLNNYDAIITGIRAYNTLTWLEDAYTNLMKYVENGGRLVVQYNTNNRLAAMKTRIFPYPFTISRNRITDENAEVNFIDDQNPILNYPNKITKDDFIGWIQERSIYNAENIDSKYSKILKMKDPGEEEQSGSLITADYGKGKIIYSGLVFFRELPAGVPGAFRLFANIISNNNAK